MTVIGMLGDEVTCPYLVIFEYIQSIDRMVVVSRSAYFNTRAMAVEFQNTDNRTS